MATACFLAWVVVLSVSSVPSGKTLDTGLRLRTMAGYFTFGHYYTGAAARQLVNSWGCDRISCVYAWILILNTVFYLTVREL